MRKNPCCYCLLVMASTRPKTTIKTCSTVKLRILEGRQQREIQLTYLAANFLRNDIIHPPKTIFKSASYLLKFQNNRLPSNSLHVRMITSINTGHIQSQHTQKNKPFNHTTPNQEHVLQYCYHTFKSLTSNYNLHASIPSKSLTHTHTHTLQITSMYSFTCTVSASKKLKLQRYATMTLRLRGHHHLKFPPMWNVGRSRLNSGQIPKSRHYLHNLTALRLDG